MSSKLPAQMQKLPFVISQKIFENLDRFDEITLKDSTNYNFNPEKFSSLPVSLDYEALVEGKSSSLKTGELMWHQQLLAGDAWNMSCFIGSSYNCPEEDGPDMDIGAPPILVSMGPEEDILLVGQKNGMVFGLDPAKEGEIIWKRKMRRIQNSS